jgi:hypothetical protein
VAIASAAGDVGRVGIQVCCYVSIQPSQEVDGVREGSSDSCHGRWHQTQPGNKQQQQQQQQQQQHNSVSHAMLWVRVVGHSDQAADILQMCDA